MKVKGLDIMLYLFKAMIIVVSVILLVVIADVIQEDARRKKEWKYEEVYRINEVHSGTLDALGIDEIYYYDWEETANSLDIPVSSLTVNIFLKHLLNAE